MLDCERLQKFHQALTGTDPEKVAQRTGSLHVHVSVPLRSGDRVLG